MDNTSYLYSTSNVAQTECLCEPNQFAPTIHTNPHFANVELYIQKTYSQGVIINWGVTNNSDHTVVFGAPNTNILVYCQVSNQYRLVFGGSDIDDGGRVDLYPGETWHANAMWQPPFEPARYKIILREVSFYMHGIHAQFVEKWKDEFGEHGADTLALRLMRFGGVDDARGEIISDCPIAELLMVLPPPHTMVTYFYVGLVD